MKCGKQESWHGAAEDLRTKLSRYAAKSRFNEEFEEAFAFFFGEGPDEMQDELEPVSFSRFMEWFVYDYRSSNGHRLVELFEMEFATELSARARYLLGEWQKSSLLLLEIKEMNRETAEARDLILGGEYSLALPPPANIQGTPKTRRLLIGRPMRVGDLWEMPGGATVLPIRLRDRLLQLIRGEFRRFRRNGGEEDWHEFLHEQGFVLNDLIDNLIDELDVEDDEVQYCVRAVYDILDMQGCVRAIRGTVDSARACERQGEAGFVAQTVSWPGMIGELRLADGRLEVICSCMEQLAAAQQALATRLGRTVRHRLDVIERCAAARLPLLRPGIASSQAVVRTAKVGKDGLVEPNTSGADHERDHGNEARPTSAAAETAAAGETTAATTAGRSHPASCARREQQKLHLDDPRPAAMLQPEWHTEEQQEVAEWFSKVLVQTGATREHVDAALWIWTDFCNLERPRVRQPAAWAAAVHVTLGRVEGWRLRNSALARVYGAKAATVSRNAALVAAALDVRQFDDRYCVEHPVDGLLKRLGAVSDEEVSHQAQEIMGACVNTVPDNQTAMLSRLVTLRGILATYAQGLVGLSRRAHDRFFGHVGCSPEDTFWQDCFADWFHFDWAIPVRGGLTILEEAVASDALDQVDAEQLALWCDCHPAYYLVEAVSPKASLHTGSVPAELVVRPLRGEGKLQVAWPLPVGALKRGDVILARLVPLDGMITSVGHALHFSASLASAIRLRLDEERVLLDHWNGRRLKWEEISARYAERLYAIAYRAARGFPDED